MRIAVSAGADRLRLEVADDGPGGADPSRGSGMRGLADRVEALGGSFEVLSPRGGGTRLLAVLPLAGRERDPATPPPEALYAGAGA